MARRSPFFTFGHDPLGSSAKRLARRSAAIHPSAGRSIGVRTQRTPPGRHQQASVSAAQRTRPIEIGATDHGSAAAKSTNEAAANDSRRDGDAAAGGSVSG